jgi:hypothetical protein
MNDPIQQTGEKDPDVDHSRIQSMAGWSIKLTYA